MDDFIIRFINKCLQIIVMFIPILIWDLIFLLQCFNVFPYTLFKGMSVICIFLLSVTILFGNSFILVLYKEDETINISFQKGTKERIIKNIIVGSLVILTLTTYASIPFYIYGGVQFLFMFFDKNHDTLTERFYKTISNKGKKETFLA